MGIEVRVRVGFGRGLVLSSAEELRRIVDCFANPLFALAVSLNDVYITLLLYNQKVIILGVL